MFSLSLVVVVLVHEAMSDDGKQSFAITLPVFGYVFVVNP